MEELRFVKKDKLTVYANDTGEFLYSIENRGWLRKNIYLISDADQPLAVVRSNLLRNKWKAEDLDQESIAIVRRSIIGKKIQVVHGKNKYSLWMNIKNKIQLLEDNSSKVAFIIDTNRLKSKDSLIIEITDYLHHHLISLISAIVIMDKKLL